MWDVLLQGLLGLAAGAAVGYGVYKIVEALWPRFVELWKGFVATAKEIFGYITEATEAFLASVAQFLQENWSELKSSLKEVFGYVEYVYVVLFKEGREILLGFVEPQQKQSTVMKLGPLEPGTKIQLPEKQHLAGVLELG